MAKSTEHVYLTLTVLEIRVLDLAASNILDHPDTWDRFDSQEKRAAARVRDKLISARQAARIIEQTGGKQ